MENKKGYWLIYDTYPEIDENIIQQNMKEFNIPYEKAKMLKKLNWNYDFGCGKRYFIAKKEVLAEIPFKMPPWWQVILEPFKDFAIKIKEVIVEFFRQVGNR